MDKLRNPENYPGIDERKNAPDFNEVIDDNGQNSEIQETQGLDFENAGLDTEPKPKIAAEQSRSLSESGQELTKPQAVDEINRLMAGAVEDPAEIIKEIKKIQDQLK